MAVLLGAAADLVVITLLLLVVAIQAQVVAAITMLAAMVIPMLVATAAETVMVMVVGKVTEMEMMVVVLATERIKTQETPDPVNTDVRASLVKCSTIQWASQCPDVWNRTIPAAWSTYESNVPN